MSTLPAKEYNAIVANLIERIRYSRLKASVAVNREMVGVYWEIGNTILQQQKEEGWGAKVIERLMIDLRTEFPDMTGLSARNIKYMRSFAEAYPHFPILQDTLAKLELSGFQPDKLVQPPVAQLPSLPENLIVQLPVAQIPWTHHLIILTKCKTEEERLFYIRKTLENNWKKTVLSLQIDQNLYARNGKALSNFTSTLPAPLSDLAIDTFKNPYVFDFLALGEQAKEKDLERALITHLKKFMLELGKGFAYVGNQYNLNVEGDDFFLDLLFFNINLNCYVIFELKIGEFKPEYAGKLNFYINAVNEQVRDEHHKPTIGVLLCRTPNDTVIKYSLAGIDQPMGVADYHLAKALPKEIKGEMPTVAELEAEIEKEYEELKNPTEKKLDRIRELAKKLKSEKITEKKNDEKSLYLLRNVFVVQQQMLWTAIKDEIVPMFQTVIHSWRVENYGFASFEEAEQQLLKHPSSHEFYYELRLEGFLDAGVNTFNCYVGFKFYLDYYHYQAQDRHSQGGNYIYKKLYHQNPSHEEMTGLVEQYKLDLLNQIEENLERITKEGK